jgi:hypothetical protein
MGIQPTALEPHGARGHIRKLRILYKYFTIIKQLYYNLWVFFHVRPANRPTITGVLLWHAKVADPRLSKVKMEILETFPESDALSATGEHRTEKYFGLVLKKLWHSFWTEKVQ